MNDLSFADERPSRKNHGDVLMQIEEILEDEQAIVGFDVRSGETFKVHLASPNELAKHFVAPRDANRTFEDRLAKEQTRVESRPSMFFDPEGEGTSLPLEVGSVVRLENTRTFTTPDGSEKTAAVWPRALVRDPLNETLILGSVQASYYETKQKLESGREITNPRIDLTVVRDQDAAPLKDFDFDEAFSGEWNGVPLTQTGVVVAMRNTKGETTVASLTTPYRKHGDPSVEAALDGPQGTYQIYAAAVVAAKTGVRSFDDLKINEQVSPKKVENARAIYEHLVANPDSTALEIAVMPIAKTQFIPTKALPAFLKDFHGTKNGKPSDNVTPDAGVSYRDKGYIQSQVAMSRHNKDPENTPASVRVIVPENKFTFKEVQAPRRIKDLGEEAVVRVHGETFGANGPQAQMAPSNDQAAPRKKAFDQAPSR